MKFALKFCFVAVVLLPIALAAKNARQSTTTTTSSTTSTSSTSTATVTVTAVSTFTTGVTVTSSTVCAAITSVTGTCRRRRGIPEEPEIIFSEKDVTNEIKPSATLSVEATAAPQLHQDSVVASAVEEGVSHFVVTGSKQDVVENSRQGRVFFSQISSFFSSLFSVAPTTTTTVTSTTTTSSTVVVSKTNTITFQGCVPGTTWSVCGSGYYGTTSTTSSTSTNGLAAVISAILSG